MADSERKVATLTVLAHSEGTYVVCNWDKTAPQLIIAAASAALMAAMIKSATEVLMEKGLPFEKAREVIIEAVCSSAPNAFAEASSGVPGAGESPPEETGL
jgi:pyrroline-5-carboxylate reductase